MMTKLDFEENNLNFECDLKKCLDDVESIRKQFVIMELIIKNGIKDIEARYTLFEEIINRLINKTEEMHNKIIEKNEEGISSLKELDEKSTKYKELKDRDYEATFQKMKRKKKKLKRLNKKIKSLERDKKDFV